MNRQKANDCHFIVFALYPLRILSDLWVGGNRENGERENITNEIDFWAICSRVKVFKHYNPNFSTEHIR